MNYAANIQQVGKSWVLRFPDFPDYSVTASRCNELLADVERYLWSAVWYEYDTKRRLPLPIATGQLRIDVPEMLLLCIQLSAALTEIAAIDPQRLERSVFFLPEPDEDFFTVVLEYDAEDVFRTFEEQGIPYKRPRLHPEPMEIRGAHDNFDIGGACAVQSLLAAALKHEAARVVEKASFELH